MSRTPVSFLFLLLISCSGGTAPEQHDDHDEHEEAGEAHGDEHEEVGLTEGAIAAARIEVAVAQLGTLHGQLEVPARITLDPRNEAALSAWVGGQVDSISVRSGDTVKKGQTLAMVQSPELGEAVGAYRGALARDRAADAKLDRLKQLEAQGVTSKAQVLEADAEHAEAASSLEAAEERLRILGVNPSAGGDAHSGGHYPSRVPIRSPLNGEVLRTDIAVGQRVAPGDRLFHVGAMEQVWLMLDIYERDLRHVAQGQDVGFTVETWPGETFVGTVDAVGDWIAPDTRTVEVRVIVDNPDHRLKPNMVARAVLTLAKQTEAQGVLLPADAVRELDGRTVVFVEHETGRFDPRTVVVKDRNSAEVLLESGLEPGERVVVAGAFAVQSEFQKAELGAGHAH